MGTVIIEDKTVRATTPEGQQAELPLSALIEKISPNELSTGQIILPDGVKAAVSSGRITVMVHQTPPRVSNFKWIAADSQSRFGPGTKYRQVRIALPYMVILLVFASDSMGRLQLIGKCECFFRNAPLDSMDDELFYPALLNCSRFEPQDGNPLSWICTQHMTRSRFARIADLNARIRASVRELMHLLLETGFNYSSEEHEGSSWYTQSIGVDERISTVERWQDATSEDPLFVLEVPWLATQMTVRQVIARILACNGGGPPKAACAADLARIIFNSQRRRRIGRSQAMKEAQK